MERQLQLEGRVAYSLALLRHDLTAGLTVAAVAVPQAMAYALIAGVEPRYGLYTAVVMTALGSLLGSSPHLINGPTNAISLVVFAAVDGVARGDGAADRIGLVCLLAVLVGLIQILIALLKLGDLTRYVSESVVIGFMSGAGVLVALSQLPALLGIAQAGTGEQPFLVRLGVTLRDGGPISLPSLMIGLSTVAVVFGLHQLGRRLRVKLPELLLTLIGMSLVVWLMGVAPPGKVTHLDVPRELPAFRLPPFSTEYVRHLWGGSLAIALLGLVEALAIAKSIAAKTRLPLDYNRQCLAEGLANLGGGFFQCLPGSGSLTRSAINYQAGAVSRLSGIFSAAAVAGTLLLFAPMAHYIPQPALAGILLWTAGRIVDRHRLLFCLRATRFDAGIALATAIAAVFISIEFSILIGTFLSFLFFVPRAARLGVTELVMEEGRVVRERQSGDLGCPLCAILNIEGELFFGAAPELHDALDGLLRHVGQGTRVVILRLKQARNPDMVCLEKLQTFLQDVQARKAVVLLCGVRPDFAHALRRLGLHHELPAEWLFLEDGGKESATLRAVQKAYQILGEERCATCPRRRAEDETAVWHYVI